MITRANRFHGLGSLRTVYREGKTVRGSAMTVRYMLDNRRKAYRLAVVVSKKVSKSAVVRNRIRRRVIEIIRTHADAITEPYDIVVTVYQDSVAAMPQVELSNSVGVLLRQAKIIN
jgi:ribonuclease P protein component